MTLLTESLETEGNRAAAALAEGERSPVAGARRPHRKDIDGLRAVAVLPIFLFHLGVAGLGGGFVGVDVFFVISGFLIGGITIRELAAGDFSIARFYQRRLRRILPALLVMLAGTTIAAWFVLLPAEMKDYAASGIGALAFGANVWFWLHAGYFDTASIAKPLLHTWSLGVEEQFYVAFPLLAMLLVRLGRRAMWPAMAILAGVSLLLSLYLTKAAPNANFYLLPSRAWELLAGVLVAITPLRWLDRRWLREAAAAAGLAAIAYAVLRYTSYTPFPGLHALAPCAGAAAIIAAGSRGETLVGRALSLAPVRFAGLISYSLYLWHWPVIVLLIQGLPADRLSPGMQLVAGIVSILLAIASWRFVETPFRRAKAGPARVFVVGAVAAGAMGLACAALIVAQGVPGRFPPAVDRMAATVDTPHDAMFRVGSCFLTSLSAARQWPARCLSPSKSRPNVLLAGDSHSAHLYPGLVADFPGSRILQASASGCRAIAAPPANTDLRCARLMRWLYSDYLPAHRPDLVILAGFWALEDLPALGPSLDRLHRMGIPVLLVGPAPVWRQPLPRLLALAMDRHDDGIPGRLLRADRFVLDRQMRAVAIATGTRYVSLTDALCAAGCRGVDPSGGPLAFDDSHFTSETSRIVARLLHDPALVAQAPAS